MYNYLRDTTKLNYLFITLTAPNIKGDELNKELLSYSKSFERMIKVKRVDRINKGYIAKLEITYNAEEDTYHPHYHVLWQCLINILKIAIIISSKMNG